MFMKERYDTREGLFASLVTQQRNSDGSFKRKGVHFQGNERADGEMTISNVDEGVIHVPHIMFLDKFYKQNDQDKLRLKRYASFPEDYPSQSIMNRLSGGETIEELQAKLLQAQQLAVTANENMDSVTGELNTTKLSLAPITQSNQELLNNIEELKSQLTIAKQQALEASTKLQTEIEEVNTSTGLSLFTDMFKSANQGNQSLETFSEIPTDLNTLAKDLGIDPDQMTAGDNGSMSNTMKNRIYEKIRKADLTELNWRDADSAFAANGGSANDVLVDRARRLFNEYGGHHHSLSNWGDKDITTKLMSEWWRRDDQATRAELVQLIMDAILHVLQEDWQDRYM